MAKPVPRERNDSESDAEFADLMAKLSEQLQSTQCIDIEELTRQYPRHADRLRRLLPALEAAAGLGDPHALSSTMVTDSVPVDGDQRRLGDFQLIREIGRGGMGVVYEAEQISLGRRVALKVLPFAGLLDTRQLQRFKNEARAAATLSHPHIVPVHFVGVERGVHYFSMQLIEGCSLAYVVDQLRRPSSFSPFPRGGEGQGNGADQRRLEDPHPNPLPQAGDGTLQAEAGDGTLGKSPIPSAVESINGNGHGEHNRGPSTRHANENVGFGVTQQTDRIIQAFISTRSGRDGAAYFRQIAQIGYQAAEALEYAHSHGIVHRDVKPANLLLDADQNIWLTDFGLARLESDVTATATGDVLGTLRYMSPEQAAGDRHLVDSRSDVYSLGATLYELLTLCPVVDGPNRPEILRRIELSDPCPPRRIRPGIPVDLETIVLKALEKEPGDRYPSARHLAADLDRFLHYRPIEARRPSVAERMNRVIRRNAAVTCVLALCMAIVTALSVTGSVFLAYKSTVAEQQRVQAESDRNRAEQHLTIARNAIDTLLTQSAAELKNSAGTSGLQLKLLDNAVQFYEQFPAEIAARPEIRYETAHVYVRVAKMCKEISRIEYQDKAWRLLQRAIGTLEVLLTQEPGNADYQLALIHARVALADQLRWMVHQYVDNRISDPELTQRAVDLARKLWASNRFSEVYRDALATALAAHYRYCIVDVSSPGYRPPTHAEVACLEQACDLLTELTEEFPANKDHQARLAGLLSDYEWALQNIGKSDRSDEIAQKQIGTVRRLVELDPDNRTYQQDLARFLTLRAVRLDEGDQSEADQLLSEAIEILGKLHEADPAVYLTRNHLLQALGSYVNFLLERKMFAKACDVLSKYIHYQRLDSEYDPGSPMADRFLRGSLYGYALCCQEVGREDEARQAFTESLEVAKRARPPRPGEFGEVGERADFVMRQVICPFEDLRDDQAVYELAKELVRYGGTRWPGRRPSDDHVTLGWAACRVGRWTEALTAFSEAKLIPSLSSWTEVDVAAGKAIALHHMGRQEESVRELLLAHRKLTKDNRGIDMSRLLQGRSLLREATAICHGEGADTLVEIDGIIQPQDNGSEDLDPAERSVVVSEAQASFQLHLLAAPVDIDGVPRVDLDVVLTRDGEPLQQEIDYIVDFDLAAESLTIRPVSNTFADGCYRISVEQTRFHVAVNSALPAVRELRLLIAALSMIQDDHRKSGFRRGPREPEALLSAQQAFDPAAGQRARFSCRPMQAESVLVAKGSVWKYLDDGTDQGTTWREPEFDDSEWKSGPAQLGYGETDQITAIGFGSDESNKFPTTYFRHQFDLGDPASIHALQLQVLRDDGVAVFLNGEEIFRDNLASTADFGAYSLIPIAGSGETSFLRASISPRFLVKGMNTLAVEIHQTDPSTSDLSFDLMLAAPQTLVVTTESLFGNDNGQIPQGSLISQAVLKILNRTEDSEVTLIRLAEPSSLGDAFVMEQPAAQPDAAGLAFQVVSTVQSWCDGGPNHGWALSWSSTADNGDSDAADVELAAHFLSPQDVAQLAWLLATDTNSDIRDPITALDLSERAVKYAGSDALSWAAYGAALYRAARWEEAVSALETAEGLSDAPAAAQVVLAMARWQLGDHDGARQLYDRVAADANNPSEEADTLSRLLLEAASLMGRSASRP